MSVTYSRAIRKAQEKYINNTFSDTLTEIPFKKWPDKENKKRLKVFVSRKFLVQIFQENDGLIRLSVNRALISGKSWQDNISWDELQSIKSDVGYGDRWAVECYPAEDKVVNVANMRHLWLLPEPPKFGWGTKDE